MKGVSIAIVFIAALLIGCSGGEGAVESKDAAVAAGGVDGAAVNPDAAAAKGADAGSRGATPGAAPGQGRTSGGDPAPL